MCLSAAYKFVRAAVVSGLCAVVLGLGLDLTWNLPASASDQGVALHQEAPLPFPHRKISNVTFVAFDTETTGFSPKTDRIVEVAVVKYRGGRIIDEKTWLVNPQRSIPLYVQKVHGITPLMVKDQPRFKDIYPEFLHFIEGSVLMAHNAPFDIAFVASEAGRIEAPLPANKVIDSLSLFRKWYPELKSHALSSVASHTQVEGDAFHRALADSAYVALIFDKGLQKLDPNAKLSDLYAKAGGPLSFRP
jgi:DNA polymerase-3 subunit alpha (Gram-positive type)